MTKKYVEEHTLNEYKAFFNKSVRQIVRIIQQNRSFGGII